MAYKFHLITIFPNASRVTVPVGKVRDAAAMAKAALEDHPDATFEFVQEDERGTKTYRNLTFEQREGHELPVTGDVIWVEEPGDGAPLSA